MITIHLNKTSVKPLFKQVVEGIKYLIDDSTINPGYQMPSTRNLAQSLGVHRSTIYKAYQELWAQGYLDSRPGTYTTVRYRQPISIPTSTKSGSIIDWKTINHHLPNRTIEHMLSNQNAIFKAETKNDMINMKAFKIDESLFPIDEFRKCISYSIQRGGSELFQYGDPQGYLPLRQFVAKRLRLHGVQVTDKEIFITNGTQSAINKVVQLIVRPGDNVIIESPGYANIFPILKFYDANIIPVPMKSDGMDLVFLENFLKEQSARLIYTMPNFQNPTGITTPHSHREKLLKLSEKYRVPIVEDAFEEEMKYFGCTPMPIKSMDINQVVLYLGSFSKILFPGIRLGWIAADPDFIQQLKTLRRFEEITASIILQAAMAEFGNRNLLDIHIKRLHTIYRKRMNLFLSSMQQKLSKELVSWITPSGGYLVWLNLKKCSLSSDLIEQVLEKKGILATIGDSYFYQKPTGVFLRLCIANLKEEQIVPAVERLASAITEIYQNQDGPYDSN